LWRLWRCVILGRPVLLRGLEVKELVHRIGPPHPTPERVGHRVFLAQRSAKVDGRIHFVLKRVAEIRQVIETDLSTLRVVFHLVAVSYEEGTFKGLGDNIETEFVRSRDMEAKNMSCSATDFFAAWQREHQFNQSPFTGASCVSSFLFVPRRNEGQRDEELANKNHRQFFFIRASIDSNSTHNFDTMEELNIYLCLG